ncbi:hypothetical protein Cpir12675_001773 [Ceratocystis pirilliformis]|uniref:Cytochrome b5 heme-binding domain-containing protein n=1 Tax=Ceratocystis pirilliformis TaxID=259994 RepID=A0ABR3ZDA4_9PEZI
MADQEIRQRKPAVSEKEPLLQENSIPAKPKSSHQRIRDEDEASASSLVLDIFRVLTFLLLASCGLSYVTSGGKSMFWSTQARPNYLTLNYWKAHMSGPIYLTPEELTAYNGVDESKPLYIAINGTIYDVTPGRRVYGPGGSYKYFAGVDAARAYVTGCFAEDRTADMRGVDEMFIPLDDPEIDSLYSPEELTALRAKEREDALEQVNKALLHWVNFYAKSDKYSKVGYVRRAENWLEKEEPRALCASAQKKRPKRKAPGKQN